MGLAVHSGGVDIWFLQKPAGRVMELVVSDGNRVGCADQKEFFRRRRK